MSSFQSLKLVHSHGHLEAFVLSDKVRIDLSISLKNPEPPEVGFWLAEAEISISDSNTGDAQYNGSTVYAIALNDGESEVIERDLITEVWPYLRTDLNLQCGRITGRELHLPWHLDFPEET